MTRTTAAVTLVLTAGILPACRRQAPDSGFAGTTAPLHRARPSSPAVSPATLRAVETASGAGYDRIVFEFAGDSVPGYAVEYASAPVRRCGSGDPVTLSAPLRLVVRFEPARAHDDQGNPVPPREERERALALSTVKEMKLVCDFEGRVEWVLGLTARAPYRARELGAPARLVLDVGRAP